MGSRNILTACLAAVLIVLTFVCWAPVLNQLSQAWVPPGWKSPVAELTDLQAPAGKQGFALGAFKISYEYKVGATQFRQSVYSAPYCCLDALALYNRYSENRTIVYFDPSHPENSKATEIAWDF